MEPQERAEKSAAAMWKSDGASQALGMKLEQVGPGHATLSMVVRKDMLNGLNTCHGGFMFTLADSAFAFACNSYNQFAFAQQCDITFLAPAHENDTLLAKAKEVAVAGRSGIYDVRIEREDGTLLANFHGHSRTVKGQHFDETTD